MLWLKMCCFANDDDEVRCDLICFYELCSVVVSSHILLEPRFSCWWLWLGCNAVWQTCLRLHNVTSQKQYSAIVFCIWDDPSWNFGSSASYLDSPGIVFLKSSVASTVIVLLNLPWQLSSPFPQTHSLSYCLFYFV
jgi:hypothetical protein